jgi:hypothetical protein
MRDDYRFRDEWLLGAIASLGKIGALAEERAVRPVSQRIVAGMQER